MATLIKVSGSRGAEFAHRIADVLSMDDCNLPVKVEWDGKSRVIRTLAEESTRPAKIRIVVVPKAAK